MDKKPNNIKDKKIIKNYTQTKFNSSFLKDKSNRFSKLGNGSTIKNEDKKNYSSINKKPVNDPILEDKDKEYFLPVYNKQKYNIKIDPKINNKGENEYTTSYMNRGISSLTQTNYIDVNRSIPKFSSRNFTLDNFIDKQILENNLIRSSSKPISQSGSKLLIDNNNLLHSSDQFSPKYTSKINQIKDDYIDFLQKHFEDSTKNNAKYDINNKELQKKINDLIQDNHLLNKTLNERMNELGKIVQENLNIKAELDKSILINQKNEQKMAFYEEQLKLFKSSNNNYQKIIEELKGQNEQLSLNLAKIKNTSEENKKKSEEKYKNDIEEIKKNMQDKIQTDDKNYESKIKSLSDEIKSLKEKNTELEKELQAKENVIQLMYKDNEKLANQNNLNNIQIEQNIKQINDMKIIIQHKENLINTLKSKEIEKEKAFFNNSNSSLKFENSEFVSDNITKLITDNEENRMKIDYLNDKLKTIDKIEQKYTDLVSGKKTPAAVPNKIYVNVNVNTDINQRTPRERKYNNKNHKLYTSSSNTNNNVKSKYDKKEIEINKNKRALISGSLPSSISSNTFNRNDIKVRRNMVVKEIKDFKDKNNKRQLNKDVEEINQKQKYTKNKSVVVIKKDYKQNAKEKGLKTLESENDNNAPFRGRSFYKKALTKKKTFEEIENKNEYERESEEMKEESRRERKKNRTYKPNIFNYSQYEVEKNRKDEKKKRNNISYYLYGIDRNDYFHIFDVSNKIWLEKEKILDLNTDGKADSFKKDYQYEGTLLCNTLEGVYILTGENTDTLYYLNSKKNLITKICKFNSCHNNGSMMYDENSKFIYVFGGKNITSCEYYSLYDKKIYKLPDLITDRANASFIISNNKIFGFFGFSYGKDLYANTIEYIDYSKKDKWVELNNIKFLKKDIKFDIESTSTTYYKQNTNKILIYSGIQGENEDFITEYYLIYDAKSNTMDKINKWDVNQYKHMGQKWREYENKIYDPKGYHFAKNSRFISIPINCVPDGYNEDDLIDALIDYKNNVHFILQEERKIDIYIGGK